MKHSEKVLKILKEASEPLTTGQVRVRMNWVWLRHFTVWFLLYALGKKGLVKQILYTDYGLHDHYETRWRIK